MFFSTIPPLSVHPCQLITGLTSWQFLAGFRFLHLFPRLTASTIHHYPAGNLHPLIPISLRPIFILDNISGCGIVSRIVLAISSGEDVTGRYTYHYTITLFSHKAFCACRSIWMLFEEGLTVWAPGDPTPEGWTLEYPSNVNFVRPTAICNNHLKAQSEE